MRAGAPARNVRAMTLGTYDSSAAAASTRSRSLGSTGQPWSRRTLAAVLTETPADAATSPSVGDRCLRAFRPRRKDGLLMERTSHFALSSSEKALDKIWRQDNVVSIKDNVVSRGHTRGQAAHKKAARAPQGGNRHDLESREDLARASGMYRRPEAGLGAGLQARRPRHDDRAVRRRRWQRPDGASHGRRHLQRPQGGSDFRR